MAEFARALVLPDISVPRRREILSLLLVWDGLELDVTESRPGQGDSELEWAAELEEAGLLDIRHRLLSADHADEDFESFDDEWQHLAEVWALFGNSDPDGLAARVAKQLTTTILDNVGQALARASQAGLAPIAATHYAALAASLPTPEAGQPVREATLIDVATRGIRVSEDTTIETVLAFREKNSPLIARFRGAMIDLSASITAETPGAAAEEAYAVVKNRVEPELANLEDVLVRGKIRFTWDMLLGLSATWASSGATTTAAAVAEAGQIAMRGLRYAFDRDRLIRDHPFGFLHRVGSDICYSTATPNTAITNPKLEIQTFFEIMIGAAINATVKAANEGRVDATRLQEELAEATARAAKDGPVTADHLVRAIGRLI
jgi:hypothetical protein